MALPVPTGFSGAPRAAWRARVSITSVTILLAAIALCGCSINLGSLSSEPENEAAKAAPAGARVDAALAATTRGQTLARSGKTEEALGEFNRAIELDPHNVQALYSRGLLYQGEKQHQHAIEDFSAAHVLSAPRADPLLGRA